MTEEIILGIDPGFGRVGYGIIKKKYVGDHRHGGVPPHGGEWRMVAFGCIETSPKKSFVARISQIHEELARLIKKHKPTRMAVEELFFFSNVKTAIEVGQARGVILLTGVENKLPIDEFTPLQVKQAITGYGRAEKSQMQKMVAIVLGMKEKIKSDDAADALAVALCAGQSLWIKQLK